MTNPVNLSEQQKAIIHQHAGAWVEIADIALELIGQGAPRMDCYQAIGLEAGRKAAAIRSWVGVRKYAGDVIDEYPAIGIDVYKVMIPVAKRTGQPLIELIKAVWHDTDVLKSPELIAVELNGQKSKRDPLDAAKTRLLQACASIEKHTTGKAQQRAIDLHIHIEQELGKIK